MFYSAVIWTMKLSKVQLRSYHANKCKYCRPGLTCSNKWQHFIGMAVAFGLSALGITAATIFVVLLIFLICQPIREYILKWIEMKPIPGLEGSYPIVGSALNFKSNSAGKSYSKANLM